MANKAYRVHRIFIQNFKLVDEAELDFEGKDLVVLDGPNGYGKTTIFDCIELTLTGKIHRINNNEVTKGNRGVRGNIFQKKKNVPTFIVVELRDKNIPDDFLVFASYLDTTPGRPKKNSNNWDKVKRVILNDYQPNFEDIQAAKVIDSVDVNTLLGIKNIESFFSILNYVQQEESLHFLKKKDADRHNLISELIDIEQEKKERAKIKQFEKKLNESTRIIEKRFELNQEKIQTLQQLDVKRENTEIEYISLFEKMNVVFRQELWDKEIKSQINLLDKNKRISKIEDVRAFLKNKDTFLANFELRKKITPDSKRNIKYFICGWSFRENISKIKKTFNDYNFFKETKKLLKIDKVISRFEDVETEKLQNLLSISIDTVTIKQLIADIVSLQVNEKNISKIISELNYQRSKIKEEFNKVIEENEGLIVDSNCPLCGSSFENNASLLESFDRQEKLLTSLVDENSLQKQKIIEVLSSNHINQILELIDKYLEKPENLINQVFLKQISFPPNFIPEIEQFITWCQRNNVSIKEQLNKQFNLPLDDEVIDNRISIIIEKIKDLEKPITDYNTYENIYNQVFDGQPDLINKIQISDLDGKIQYINNQFNTFNNQELLRLKDEEEQLEQKISRNNLVLNKVSHINQTYKNEIKAYTKKVIKEIEILFFIYSGRIIQEYENGNGLFIETFDKQKYQGENVMIFTSKPNGEHDALHSLSSGQLSALVIAFMLTLNKIYGDNGLNTILIDDPVQTMDDINSASFVDILRNEFYDRQHILSTHELDSSLYIRYKFKKYGLKIHRINVKNELDLLIR